CVGHVSPLGTRRAVRPGRDVSLTPPPVVENGSHPGGTRSGCTSKEATVRGWGSGSGSAGGVSLERRYQPAGPAPRRAPAKEDTRGRLTQTTFARSSLNMEEDTLTSISKFAGYGIAVAAALVAAIALLAGTAYADVSAIS